MSSRTKSLCWSVSLPKLKLTFLLTETVSSEPPAGNVVLMFGFYCINFYSYHLFMVNETGFYLIATHKV